MSGRSVLGPSTGVAFVLLAAAAAAVGDPNGFGASIGLDRPAGEVAIVFAENRERLRTSAYLTLAAVAFLVFFLGHLREALRRPGDGGDVLASVAHGAGLVAAAVMLVGASIAVAASEARLAQPEAAMALLTFGWDYYAVVAAPATALAVASALAVLGGAPLPRWFGWVSAGLAVLLVALLVARTAGLGTGAFLAWAFAASLALWRTERTPAPDPRLA